MSTIFTRIIRRELLAKIFYETDQVIVIADHRPKAPVHLLIISKPEHQDFQHLPSDSLQACAEAVRVVAEKLGISDHYQLAINNGLGQEVPHFHIHFLSNRGMDRLKYLEK
jgi:histidine triad (HIT) family protein